MTALEVLSVPPHEDLQVAFYDNVSNMSTTIQGFTYLEHYSAQQKGHFEHRFFNCIPNQQMYCRKF